MSRLQIPTNQRISPYLVECCLRASATISYENAAKDLEKYTGMRVSARTQQRLVHRQDFPEEEVKESIEEISLDGLLDSYPSERLQCLCCPLPIQVSNPPINRGLEI